jgi:hypothetical protein
VSEANADWGVVLERNALIASLGEAECIFDA